MAIDEQVNLSGMVQGFAKAFGTVRGRVDRAGSAGHLRGQYLGAGRCGGYAQAFVAHGQPQGPPGGVGAENRQAIGGGGAHAGPAADGIAVAQPGR